MRITFGCPDHGAWQADLASPRSRSKCPAPGCKVRGIPAAGQFRAAHATNADLEAHPAIAGWAEADDGARLDDLDAATAALPAPHRAMIRLMACAVIDRHHQPGDGHMGGIAAGNGDTRTGKTLIGLVVCAAFGLDQVTHVLQVAGQTERSLWGRRVSRDGGQWELVPAPVLSRPFAVLDELDKAPGDLRKVALRLLQGTARAEAEGQAVTIAPVPFVTSNGGLAVIPASYRRRSACLDTSGMDPVSYATARQVLAAVPRLPLERLRPSAEGLPAGALGSLTRGLEAALTPEGVRLCDVRGLERLAAARAALNGGSIPQAVAGTLDDYLRCAATTGATVPGWRDLMIAAATGSTPATPARSDAEPVTGPPAPAVRFLERVAAIGAAATWKARISRALDGLDEATSLPGAPADDSDRADGIIAAGEDVIAFLGEVQSADALDRLLPAAEQVTSLANELAGVMRASAAPVIAVGQRQAEMQRPAAWELDDAEARWRSAIRERQLAGANRLALPAGRGVPQRVLAHQAVGEYLVRNGRLRQPKTDRELTPTAVHEPGWPPRAPW